MEQTCLEILGYSGAWGLKSLKVEKRLGVGRGSLPSFSWKKLPKRVMPGIDKSVDKLGGEARTQTSVADSNRQVASSVDISVGVTGKAASIVGGTGKSPALGAL